MKARNFVSLCAVTVVAVAVAAWTITQRPTIQSSDYDSEPLFPGLVDELNDLRTVVIRQKDGTFTLNYVDGNWVFAERDNYPAKEDAIGDLAVKLARMEKIEPKTKLPERYDRLSLLDPEDGEDNTAKEVTLKDGDGNVLAQVLVGKRKFTLGTSEGGTYVRMPDDPQTWLVTGELNPGQRARDWLQRDIVDIKDDDIRRIVVTHPDGEVLVVSKSDPEQPNYTVEDIPEGRELRRDSIADDLGRVLSTLLLDDVNRANDLDFPAEGITTARFEGFEGFSVDVQLIESGEENWIKVRGMPPAASSEEEATGELPDWAARMAELNARTEGWAFQIPAFEVNPIKKRMTDMIREPEDAAGS